LDPGDAISKISGFCGDFVTSVRIWLKSGRDSGQLAGSVAVQDFEYDGGSQQIVGLWGRTGAWIDAIGVYSA
jgi:Jacalin-like lectin domain